MWHPTDDHDDYNRDTDFDLDFDRDKSLHSVDRCTYYQPTSSLRVHQIFEKPVFFANNERPSTEVLGWGSNDGTFLGALGTAATGGFLERICVAVNGSPEDLICNLLMKVAARRIRRRLWVYILVL